MDSRLSERLPCAVPRMYEDAFGAVEFYLRNDHWGEDLADALAIMCVAVPEDDITFKVKSESRRTMLEISLECSNYRKPNIIVLQPTGR